MKGKRRAHSDKFKAKIAIEAIKGIKTLSELATEFYICFLTNYDDVTFTMTGNHAPANN